MYSYVHVVISTLKCNSAISAIIFVAIYLAIYRLKYRMHQLLCLQILYTVHLLFPKLLPVFYLKSIQFYLYMYVSYLLQEHITYVTEMHIILSWTRKIFDCG